MSSKIALDVMGGDFGVSVNLAGAVAAAREMGVETVLVGDESAIAGELKRQQASNLKELTISHAASVIGMDEHPSLSVRKKADASINVAFDLLKSGAVSAVVSAGNSGAMMASGLTRVRRIRGIARPAITVAFPTKTGTCVGLDMGANVDCRPSHLVQFAIMGEVYARVVQGKLRPSVGLLSNGKEESKGNELTRYANEILKAIDINYLGFVEGKEVFRGPLDVVVCDGFMGNALLKSLEGIIEAGIYMFHSEFQNDFFSRVGLRLFNSIYRKKINNITRKFDYAEYGAAPLLGLNGIVYVCHGSSSQRAIKNALFEASSAIESQFLDRLRTELMRLAPASVNSFSPFDE